MKPIAPESSQSGYKHVGENLYRRETSGIYYALIKKNGKQFRRSLKTGDREIAKRKLNELRSEVGTLRLQGGPAPTFKETGERWLSSIQHTLKESTVLRRKMCLKALEPFFEGVTIRNATKRHCEEWASKRGSLIAPDTFAHELSAMRAVFDYAREQGVIYANPALSIKRKRIIHARVEVPTREQFTQLVKAIRFSDGRESSQAKAKDGADLVELLAYSGCRLDEARNLKWADVTFEGDNTFITVTGGENLTKNYEVRTVPMTDSLFGLLTRLKSQTLPQPTDFIVKIQSAKKCLQTACKKLGLPVFTHHDFRHFFATTCIESGVDIPTISKWLGHKDGGALAMRVYGHLRQAHSFAEIKKVNFAAKP